MTKLIYADLTYILRGTFFEVYHELVEGHRHQ